MLAPCLVEQVGDCSPMIMEGSLRSPGRMSSTPVTATVTQACPGVARTLGPLPSVPTFSADYWAQAPSLPPGSAVRYAPGFEASATGLAATSQTGSAPPVRGHAPVTLTSAPLWQVQHNATWVPPAEGRQATTVAVAQGYPHFTSIGVPPSLFGSGASQLMGAVSGVSSAVDQPTPAPTRDTGRFFPEYLATPACMGTTHGQTHRSSHSRRSRTSGSTTRNADPARFLVPAPVADIRDRAPVCSTVPQADLLLDNRDQSQVSFFLGPGHYRPEDTATSSLLPGTSFHGRAQSSHDSSWSEESLSENPQFTSESEDLSDSVLYSPSPRLPKRAKGSRKRRRPDHDSRRGQEESSQLDNRIVSLVEATLR